MVMLAKGNRSKMVVQACQNTVDSTGIGGSAARLAQNCTRKWKPWNMKTCMEAIRK